MIHINRNKENKAVITVPCNIRKKHWQYNLLLKDNLSKDGFNLCVADSKHSVPLWYEFEIDTCTLPSGRYSYYLTNHADLCPSMYDIDYLPDTKHIRIFAKGLLEIRN